MENNMEDLQLTMTDEEGNEILYNVLLTFDSEEFEKSYVLIVPAEEPEDEDEEVEVLAYSYTQKEDGSFDELIPVESDEEWDMIEEVFNTDFAEALDDEDDHDHHDHE
jgi:uncharacterized protein YrzB (UPF0473 family)